ncbi:hypothetical protein ACJX0J_024997, partial [Zea mays]
DDGQEDGSVAVYRKTRTMISFVDYNEFVRTCDIFGECVDTTFGLDLWHNSILAPTNSFVFFSCHNIIYMLLLQGEQKGDNHIYFSWNIIEVPNFVFFFSSFNGRLDILINDNTQNRCNSEQTVVLNYRLRKVVGTYTLIYKGFYLL